MCNCGVLPKGCKCITIRTKTGVACKRVCRPPKKKKNGLFFPIPKQYNSYL